MQVNKLLTPYNLNSAGDTGRIKYIVIHYVGATGGAKANAQHYASKYIGASAHYFVDFSGEIWQSVEDGDIAWHCGAKSYQHPECRNSNSIGIELCVRNNGNKSAESKDWWFEDATVAATAELARELMRLYSIPAENVIRHHDVTGKICPNPFVYNHTKHTWDEFKSLLTDAAGTAPAMTKITGKEAVTAEQMAAYIQMVNSGVPGSVLEMLPHYLTEGNAENIRGDIAFAQSCLETGNFAFTDTAVTLAQNNFCGMGVTSNGITGATFPTAQIGIRAQIQHLKAYANTAKLKEGCVDPRFDLVSRGCAPYVEYLGVQENPKGKGWATGAGYGNKILTILNKITGGAENPEAAPIPHPPAAPPETAGYTVTTTCDVLNIRTGAGTDTATAGQIAESEGKKNLYTIVEEQNGWGRLKSGAGWICLSYTKRSGAGQAQVFQPYTVTTTCNVLNIRAGAGTDTNIVGKITEPQGRKNQYTIVEEQNGWGRLKSGAGWISLEYIARCS